MNELKEQDLIKVLQSKKQLRPTRDNHDKEDEQVSIRLLPKLSNPRSKSLQLTTKLSHLQCNHKELVVAAMVILYKTGLVVKVQESLTDLIVGNLAEIFDLLAMRLRCLLSQTRVIP